MTGKHRIWDRNEALPREQLRALQLDRLQQSLAQASKTPMYGRRFEEMGLEPEDIRSLDDVRRLPFTTKDDMRDNYPLGLLAVPRREVRRVHGSSGTTGKPTFVAYSGQDIEVWRNLCARFLVAGGLTAEHLVHIAFGYGLFTGGFGLHYGVETVGAAIVPAASGNTRRQVMLLSDLEADVLICTPSYALVIAEMARYELGGTGRLALRYGHFGGEPWTEDMRGRIESELHIQAFNNYGLSEVMGPGVSGECHLKAGMHIQEDHFLVECINPDTLEPVAPGEIGELVFTTLTKQAMPTIRYRTRDLASLDETACECGRTTVRMSRVIGRSDDMVIIRGVNVFPSQIEEALLRVEGTAPHYLIEIDRPALLDEVTVHVEVLPEVFSDEMRKMQKLRDRIDREVHTITGIRAKINLVQPQSLERSAGKAVRVLDRRKEREQG